MKSKIGLQNCQQWPKIPSSPAWVQKPSPAHISQILGEARFLCAARPMLCSGLRLGCWGAGIPGRWREVASVLTDTLWNTGVCNLLGYSSGCCPARASKFAGGPVLTHMGSYEFGPRAGLMGIRSLGLTCAECIVCWLLSCHLETISIEMVLAVCCVLRCRKRHSPAQPWFWEPGALYFL